MNAVEREVPVGKTVHAILDNYGHPQASKDDRFLRGYQASDSIHSVIVQRDVRDIAEVEQLDQLRHTGLVLSFRRFVTTVVQEGTVVC